MCVCVVCVCGGGGTIFVNKDSEQNTFETFSATGTCSRYGTQHCEHE